MKKIIFLILIFVYNVSYTKTINKDFNKIECVSIQNSTQDKQKAKQPRKIKKATKATKNSIANAAAVESKTSTASAAVGKATNSKASTKKTTVKKKASAKKSEKTSNVSSPKATSKTKLAAQQTTKEEKKEEDNLSNNQKQDNVEYGDDSEKLKEQIAHLEQRVEALEAKNGNELEQQSNTNTQSKISVLNYVGIVSLILIIGVLIFIFLDIKKRKEIKTKDDTQDGELRSQVSSTIRGLKQNEEKLKQYVEGLIQDVGELKQDVGGLKEKLKNNKSNSSNNISNNITYKGQKSHEALSCKVMYATWSTKDRVLYSYDELTAEMQFKLTQINANEVSFEFLNDKIIKKSDFEGGVCEIIGTDESKGYETIEKGQAENVQDGNVWKVKKQTKIEYTK